MPKQGYTVEEWINSIKDPVIKAKALRAMANEKDSRMLGLRNTKLPSLGKAINHAFTWSNTEEGSLFWSDLSTKYTSITSIEPEQSEMYPIFTPPLN